MPQAQSPRVRLKEVEEPPACVSAPGRDQLPGRWPAWLPSTLKPSLPAQHTLRPVCCPPQPPPRPRSPCTAHPLTRVLPPTAPPALPVTAPPPPVPPALPVTASPPPSPALPVTAFLCCSPTSSCCNWSTVRPSARCCRASSRSASCQLSTASPRVSGPYSSAIWAVPG